MDIRESAFPNNRDIRNRLDFDNEPGLTKREYISALMLQGLVCASGKNSDSQFNIHSENYVHKAIQLTDELLKQLEK